MNPVEALRITLREPGGTNNLQATSSADGATWITPAVTYNKIQMGSAPAVAAYNNKYYLGFQANDPSHAFYVTESVDAFTWVNPATPLNNVQVGGSPAMIAFNNQLIVAFRANDSSDALYVMPFDGEKWGSATAHTSIRLGNTPVMAVFGTKLFMAFQSNDGSGNLCVTSSEDGLTWTGPIIAQSQIQLQGVPAMIAFSGSLYIAFQSGQALYVASSTDGTTWTSPVSQSDMRTAGGPAFTVANDTLFLAFPLAGTSPFPLAVTYLLTGSSWAPVSVYKGIPLGSAPAMVAVAYSSSS